MPPIQIYLDHAATTPIDPTVVKAMEPYFSTVYGNPSSTHALGNDAQHAVESSRQTVANILRCQPSEIVFTSGGTESINLALQGVARALKNKGNHIITSAIEHPAVLETCRYLAENEGFKITHLRVDQYGVVDPVELEKAITQDTILVSIMYANNEIGTIQNIPTLANICRKKNVYFHTDACQAAGLLDICVDNLGVDLMTLNASKIYGPKGTGILYIRTGVCIQPLFFGGGQEHNLRSGTENVPGIVGFTKALSLAEQQQEQETKRLSILRDQLISGIQQTIPHAILHGHPTKRLPNNVNFSFPTIDGDAFVTLLSQHGIFASTGSACTSSTIEPSHVLVALGLPETEAYSSIRFTLGKNTTEQDIHNVLKLLPLLLQQTRQQHTFEPEQVLTS